MRIRLRGQLHGMQSTNQAPRCPFERLTHCCMDYLLGEMCKLLKQVAFDEKLAVESLLGSSDS